ncbi:MAG: copper resistance protein B [Desulfuromonadales bacterium]|nr:copper resistance protein B [Desulfuromonadales bacterium]
MSRKMTEKAIICLILWAFIFGPGSLNAAEGMSSHATDRYPADYQEVETTPKVGQAIQKYAADAQQGPQQNFGIQPIHDNQIFATFRADRFEHQWREHGMEAILWDVQGWIGNDYNKLYLKSEGDLRLDDDAKIEEADVELFYSRNIAKFWDLQMGLRYDFEPDPERSFVAFGFQGLAPQWFEIDATAYLSEDGDVSARIEAEYELMLTQRLVLIPRVETGLSMQDVPEYEQWQGITDVTVGARLMYHLRREFAPYLGVSWSRKIGETANRLESENVDVDSAVIVAGVRFWF